MEAVAVTIALVQGAEILMKAGKRLVAVVSAYKHSDAGFKELILRVEGVWLKTEIQINVILDIFSHPGDHQPQQERLLSFQEQCFDTLATKVQTSLSKLGTWTGRDLTGGIDVHEEPAIGKRFTKLRYAVFERHLQSLITELESWHSIFDPSWYLLARLVNPEVDRALSKTEDQPDEAKGSATNAQSIRDLNRNRNKASPSQDSQALPTPKISFLSVDYVVDPQPLGGGSNLQIGITAETKQTVLLDTTAYLQDTNPKTVIGTVRKIAELLSITAPFSMGFLRCLGIIRLDDRQFQYVLALPDQRPPRLLRSLLLLSSPSLDARFRIARALAKTIMSLHAASFVHKNIRPETIVVQNDKDGESSQAYLVGFQQLRPDMGHSSLVADMVWQRNIYRHPNRQGLNLEEFYVMQHDIYSLGVCLLEIGLWTSFVAQDAQSSPSFDVTEELKTNNLARAAAQIKNRLIEKTTTELPSRMGRTYTEVVLSCLTCLDQGAANMFEHEDDLYDDDGILVGVAFIEKILVKLEDINI